MKAVKLFLFTGQCLILLACVFYIQYVYYATIYPDKLAKNTYEQTTCIINKKELTSAGKFVQRYSALFVVSYVAQGIRFQGLASGNGVGHPFTTDKASQQNILQQFELGENYSCWFNPDVPTSLILVQRHNWSSTFSFFIPVTTGLIMIYLLLRYSLFPKIRKIFYA